LIYNPVVIAYGQFGTSEDRCAWKISKNHDHLPLEENILRIHNNGDDIHVELFTTFCKTITHRGELFNSLHPLDAILEDDVLMIVGKNV
jgi:hypothetical protein